jgi:hypothetical protein
MPPEVLSESKCMCCKSQDISSGIMELGKIRFEFGSRIAVGRLATGKYVGERGIAPGGCVRETKHAF